VLDLIDIIYKKAVSSLSQNVMQSEFCQLLTYSHDHESFFLWFLHFVEDLSFYSCCLTMCSMYCCMQILVTFLRTLRNARIYKLQISAAIHSSSKCCTIVNHTQLESLTRDIEYCMPPPVQ